MVHVKLNIFRKEKFSIVGKELYFLCKHYYKSEKSQIFVCSIIKKNLQFTRPKTHIFQKTVELSDSFWYLYNP